VNADLVHKSVLAGLLSQIGVRDDRTAAPPTRGGRPTPRRGSVEFLGARQLRFSVFPGSALAKRPPPALMSAELVETSRLFARMNAAIDPAWAEAIAGDLVKRTVGDPRWEQRQGAAVADERVTLFGVPIVEKRRIQYARVDPVHARDLLLEHAFLEGEWPRETARDRAYDFDRANRRLRRELDEEAERTRRPPVDEQRIIEFYDARIPAEVHSVREFEAWWREAKEQTPDLLDMVRADLVEEEDAPDVDPREFPPYWRQGEQRLKLRYRFAPGAADDGVTVQVPLPLLAGLSPAGFDWQVPGFRQDLVAALLKTLPKPQRRFVVPTGDWARRLLPELPAGPETGGVPGPLADALALVVRRVAGANPAPADFEAERLPPHLRMAFEVLDARGRPMARDLDLVALQRRFAEQARASVAKAVAAPTPARLAIERSGLTTFDLDELPRVLDTRQSGGVVRAYPALVDTGSAVDVRLLATREEQTAAMRLGIRRLLLLATPSPAHYVREHLSGAEKLALAASPYPSTDALFADCLVAVVEAAQAAGTEDGSVWTRAGFERLRDRLAAAVLDDLFAVVGATAAALAGARDADAAIRRATSLALLPALTDARGQLDALVHPGFVSIDGAARLPRLAVYTAGIVRRVERLPEQANRDRVWMTEVAAATELYLAAGGVLPLTRDVPERLVRVRWLLEELRLSLFAQSLPAAEPVSLQRIRKALA
jgi:ATP-dependent helicase HrpA